MLYKLINIKSYLLCGTFCLNSQLNDAVAVYQHMRACVRASVRACERAVTLFLDVMSRLSGDFQ